MSAQILINVGTPYLLGNVGSIRRAAEVLIKVGSNIDRVGQYSHFWPNFTEIHNFTETHNFTEIHNFSEIHNCDQ